MKRFWSVLPLILATALAGANALPTSAQETSNSATNALALDAAIRLALQNNPSLRASGARVDAASGRAHQAGRWANPELELSAEDWPVESGRGFSDAKQLIGIAQTLPYPGKKSLDRQIGGAGVKLSAAELALRRTEIVRDTKAGFFRVLAAKQMVEVSAQLVAVADSAAVAARRRVEAGAAAYQEQLRAEVQLEQARNDLAERQRDLAASKQKLAMLLGVPNLRTYQLAGTLSESANAMLLQTAEETWRAQHPSTAMAKAELNRTRLEQRRARLEPYPDVKVGLAGGRVGETDESIIQLGVSFPLPLLDRGKGNKQEAQANVNAAEAELDAVDQQLQTEWVKARERYRTALAQVTRYRDRILPKAGEALQLVQTGFDQGKFNFIDLVDTQRTDAEARLAYQEKVLELNLAEAELEALLQPQAGPTATSGKN